MTGWPQHGFNAVPDTHGTIERVAMPDADVCFYPSFFAPREADALFDALRHTIDWKRETITLYGKAHHLPRLTAWYGDPHKTYRYSGIKVEASDWTPALRTIKKAVEPVSAVRFNSVLLNLYRDGSDSVAWHSDDEPELGNNPVIGSVSFGAERVFQMKQKTHREEQRQILLTHGSYLLMKGSTQHHWLHQIPKSRTPMGERMNLTFRIIMA